ncbi:mycothiol synthase [Microlunatus soli]|uniref:Mycothiol synthase n=2 Tax=Microlunatus soli TaxID=630515 RepID=A0A1H1U077_9ACTN|nr:mycothiol synthase [Microlunatus soli]
MTHPGPLDHAEPVLPGDLRMREATDVDTAELADALTDAFEDDWSTSRVTSALLGAADVPRTWVITHGSRIVATASERVLQKYPDAGYLHWVGVRREARGQSLGKVVTVACLRGFTERGFRRAVLETEIFRHAAVRTYLRLGFVPEYRSDEERAAWSTLLPQLLAASGKPSSRQA